MDGLEFFAARGGGDVGHRHDRSGRCIRQRRTVVGGDGPRIPERIRIDESPGSRLYHWTPFVDHRLDYFAATAEPFWMGRATLPVAAHSVPRASSVENPGLRIDSTV